MLPGWGGPRLDQASSVQTAPNKTDLLVRPKYAEVDLWRRHFERSAKEVKTVGV